MKLSVIRRILKENLQGGGELPKWLDSLLSPLNQFLENVYVALNGRLTFEDNFLCTAVSQRFPHGVEKEIAIPGRLQVTGMIPIYTGSELLDGYGFVTKSNGTVGVTLRFVNTSAEPECKIILLLG